MAILEPWNMVFAIGFIIYVVIRGLFASRTKENQQLDRRVGLQERLLLSGMMITAMLFPLLYLLTPAFSFADYALPEFAHWLGLVLMVAGLWFFWRSHADLGLNWSKTLEIRKGHEIVRHGCYRRIRHPMYAAIWLFSVSQALLLNNWLAGWGVVVAFVFMYFLRVPQEEQMLRDQFGERYDAYMAETGRLFPNLFRHKT